MKTTRKPAPTRTPAWAKQFISLCGLLADSCSTTDDALHAARASLGCMAELGNVRGDLYTEVAAATSAYVRAAAWYTHTLRAYSAAPWREEDFPEFMRVALDGASRHRAATHSALEAVLCEVRPSLPMT